MPKDTTDKQDDFAFQFKEMQEQMRELVLESRLLRQNREERSKLATRLASLEAELETPVSTINNPLFAQPSKDHYHHNLTKPLITFPTPIILPHPKNNITMLTKPHSKWKYSDLMVKMLLVGFLKLTPYLIFITHRRINEFQ